MKIADYQYFILTIINSIPMPMQIFAWAFFNYKGGLTVLKVQYKMKKNTFGGKNYDGKSEDSYM